MKKNKKLVKDIARAYPRQTHKANTADKINLLLDLVEEFNKEFTTEYTRATFYPIIFKKIKELLNENL